MTSTFKHKNQFPRKISDLQLHLDVFTNSLDNHNATVAPSWQSDGGLKNAKWL